VRWERTRADSGRHGRATPEPRGSGVDVTAGEGGHGPATGGEVVRQAVPLEDVVLAQAFQLEALLNVLERRGIIKKAAVVEEIKRLQAETPKGT